LESSTSTSTSTSRTSTVNQAYDKINIHQNYQKYYPVAILGIFLMQQENMLRPKFINYATAIMIEINPAINYGRSTFGMICRLSKFHKNKPFRDMTREDAVAFLDSLRKTEIEENPLHQWIGTYSPYRIRHLRFVKWLCSPNTEQSLSPKTPSTLKKGVFN
jgi:hypothetical protein